MFSLRVDENLDLILPQNRHAEEITAAVLKNLEQLKFWMPWVTDDYSIETALDFIKTNLHEFAESNTFATAIVHNGEIVGTIGFHHFDNVNKSIQIGYWLDKNVQGQGLATKCCGFLVTYAFKNLDINRVQINCNTDNLKSRSIPERLGFQLEGVLRQVEWLNESFHDSAVYSMLKEDWKEQSKK